MKIINKFYSVKLDSDFFTFKQNVTNKLKLTKIWCIYVCICMYTYTHHIYILYIHIYSYLREILKNNSNKTI